MFNVLKQPVPVCGGAFLVQKPHLHTRTETSQAGRKSAWDASTRSAYPKIKGCHGHSVPAVLQSTSSSLSTFSSHTNHSLHFYT